MKENNYKIKGVFHQQASSAHYYLRRYFPSEKLTPLVEQFWLVDWQIKENTTHTQQNLPDPNFHLIFDGKSLKLIAPISKTYSYQMLGDGKIYGVKFRIAALATLLDMPIKGIIDRELSVEAILGGGSDTLTTRLLEAKADEDIVIAFEHYLSPYAKTASLAQMKTEAMFNEVKTNCQLKRVEQLSKSFQLSERSIQRYFLEYIGFSPKWLIRKYRIVEALEHLELDKTSFTDLVAELGYTDQSHLIKDFKAFRDLAVHKIPT